VQHARAGATIFTPFLVIGLFRAYGVGGVLALMIGLLVVQIVVVAAWGIEPARRGLETLAPAARLAGGD
jgi:putative MFS transporter